MLAAFVRTGRFLTGHPLTRDHKCRAIARFVSWQVRSRLKDELVVPWIEGTRLAVRRGMAGATGNLYVGLHEFADMAFLLHFLRSGDRFVDVGANVGSYTVLASGVRRARTVAFEPDPEAAAALRRNVEINRLADLVTVHEVALGDAPGDARLTIGLNTTNHVLTEGGGPSRIVRMETLDRLCAEDPPIMIKLDVEGHERQVLKGAARLLAAPALEAVLSEDGSPAVADLVRGTGFARFGYDPFRRELVASGEGCLNNPMFIRTPAFVQHRVAAAAPVRAVGVEF